MGLDMWLYANRVFWSKKDEEVINKVSKLFLDMRGYPINKISFEVGYWRKANHIHNFFIMSSDNEDKMNFNIPIETLKELKKICSKVLSLIKKSKIVDDEYSCKKELEEILPTTSGFFFGSTNYDEYYKEDIENTLEILNKCLALGDDYYFEYHCSW